MAIEITSRNKDIPGSMQEYARGKAAAIEKEYPKTTSVKVVLDLDRHLYGAHFTATVDGFQFDAEASDPENLAKAIDEAADKADRQIRKQLDKIGDNRK